MFRYASTFAISLGLRTSLKAPANFDEIGLNCRTPKDVPAAIHREATASATRMPRCEWENSDELRSHANRPHSLFHSHTKLTPGGTTHEHVNSQIHERYGIVNEFTKLPATTRREFCRGPRALFTVKHCAIIIIHLFGNLQICGQRVTRVSGRQSIIKVTVGTDMRESPNCRIGQTAHTPVGLPTTCHLESALQ